MLCVRVDGYIGHHRTLSPTWDTKRTLVVVAPHSLDYHIISFLDILFHESMAIFLTTKEGHQSMGAASPTGGPAFQDPNI